MHYLIRKHAKPSRQPKGQPAWGLYVVHEDSVLMQQLARFKSLKAAQLHASLLAGRSIPVMVEVS